jgi:hypothetical protein
MNTIRTLLAVTMTLSLLACAAPERPWVQAQAPLEATWGPLRAHVECAEPVAVHTSEGVLFVAWGPGVLRIEEQAGELLVRSGSNHENSWPVVSDWPLRPVGSGSFSGGVSLRLLPAGEVEVLASGSKLDAVPQSE